MVDARQKREIRELMVDIKEAKRNGASDKVIEERTQRLVNYLHKEGIVYPFNE